MFSKLTVVIVLAAGIGAALLHLRQQRLELAHEIAGYHQQINVDRQATWDLQVRIHENLSPRHLREAIDRRQLNLVPMVPTDPNTTVLAEADHALHP
jgi:cell division protein FtsL